MILFTSFGHPIPLFNWFFEYLDSTVGSTKAAFKNCVTYRLLTFLESSIIDYSSLLDMVTTRADRGTLFVTLHYRPGALRKRLQETQNQSHSPKMHETNDGQEVYRNLRSKYGGGALHRQEFKPFSSKYKGNENSQNLLNLREFKLNESDVLQNIQAEKNWVENANSVAKTLLYYKSLMQMVSTKRKELQKSQRQQAKAKKSQVHQAFSSSPDSKSPSYDSSTSDTTNYELLQKANSPDPALVVPPSPVEGEEMQPRRIQQSRATRRGSKVSEVVQIT